MRRPSYAAYAGSPGGATAVVHRFRSQRIFTIKKSARLCPAALAALLLRLHGQVQGVAVVDQAFQGGDDFGLGAGDVGGQSWGIKCLY